MFALFYFLSISQLIENIFDSRYPFDWQTPIGYFVVWVNQTTACSVFVWLMISMTALYYGFCIFMGTFMEDYRQSLLSIEDKMQAGVDNEKKLSRQAETEIKKEIMAIIQFHTEALQLSLNISILDDYLSSFMLFPSKDSLINAQTHIAL